MKTLLRLVLILLTISCSNALQDGETLGLLALLGYRQSVIVGGTFFGNFNADVKAVPLSVEGKCDRNSSALGVSSTDDSGVFRINYTRVSPQNGYVCIIASPRADGNSRFLDLTTQTRLPWTGDGFSVLVLPEPSTTTRSKFNVSSTMFNRMALQKLEAQASGNSDYSRMGRLLRSSNRQVVSQFGLSRGLGRSTGTPTLGEIFFSGLTRETSFEASIPDLNDIQLDFSKKDDPVTLKFTVVIGGIQKLADPNDPSSFDKVVNLVSELVAGTRTTATFPGGASVGAGQSFGAVVAQKVNSFVVEQASTLGLSTEQVATIQTEVATLAAAIDNPPLKPPTAEPVTGPLYSTAVTTLKQGDSISISPLLSGYSNFLVTEICPSPTNICQPVSPGMTGGFIVVNNSTGVVTITPPDIPGDQTIKLKIKATRSGVDLLGEVNLAFRGKPALFFVSSPGLQLNYKCTTDGGVTATTCSPQTFQNLFEVSGTGTSQSLNLTVNIYGPYNTLSAPGLSFNIDPKNPSLATLTGELSAGTLVTIKIGNDLGERIYYLKLNNIISSCTGGSISSITVSGLKYRLHTFTSSGELNCSSSRTVDMLLVAGGGGGGGGRHGGGGGAGGFLEISSYSLPSGYFTVTVGSGGSGSNSTTRGSNGEGSSLSSDVISISAIGGGGGAACCSSPTGTSGNGGSGGGGVPTAETAGSGSSGQGSSGGLGENAPSYYGTGGGGGAGTPGGNGTGANGGGNGGNGRASSITGTSLVYAGGGGGNAWNGGYIGVGGSGGGGNGCYAENACQAGNGQPNTGGGGGGAASYFDNGSGGNGGSGIVIIRYQE